MLIDGEEYPVFKIVFGSIVAILLIIGILWGYGALDKVYDVWASKKVGQAQLAHAEFERHIKVYEAQAFEEAAKHLAQAEIERAKGVAEANKIIGDSLKGNESYLRYLWITNLDHSQKEVIYVPTEANIPILEAGKR
jgi:hypothetical protein